MTQKVAAKFLMDTFDGVHVPVLKYHAHIFDITWRRKINPIEINNQHGKNR